jgi:hypothetical protein
MCVDQKSVSILLVTPLGKKDQVAKTFDLNNIVTASLQDLPPEEQQKYKALQEYMHVQVLADI